MWRLVGKDRRMESPIVFTPKLFLIPIVWEKGSISCVFLCVCVPAEPGSGDPVWPDPARSHKSSIEAWRPGDTALLLLPYPRCIPPGGRARGREGVLLIREKETIPWLGRTLFHSLLVEIKLFLYFYICFLQPLGPFFSRSSHVAFPQPALSLINPVSSMALINRTLFTSYTWPARCLKLPPMSSASLSFPLFPSIFFHLFFFFSFQHFIFSSSRSFYTSGFHTSDFGLWIWLVKESSRRRRTHKLHLWKDPPSYIYSLILQGQLQLSMVLQHVWTQCVFHWLLAHEHD